MPCIIAAPVVMEDTIMCVSHKSDSFNESLGCFWVDGDSLDKAESV